MSGHNVWCIKVLGYSGCTMRRDHSAISTSVRMRLVAQVSMQLRHMTPDIMSMRTMAEACEPQLPWTIGELICLAVSFVEWPIDWLNVRTPLPLPTMPILSVGTRMKPGWPFHGEEDA